MESLAYPDFQYFHIQKYYPPGRAGRILYDSLVDRYLNGYQLEHVPITERIGPCWIFDKNKLSHRWMGSITLQHMAYLFRFPEDYNDHYRPGRKRVRFDFHRKCGNKHCFRPDHVIPHKTWQWHTVTRHVPIKRNPNRDREEWLTYPETRYLQAIIATQSRDPEDFIVEYAEHIALNNLTVADLWRTFVANDERQFAEWCRYDYE